MRSWFEQAVGQLAVMPASSCDAPDAVELDAAELLHTIAPLVERAPQLFHALAIVLNPRPCALGKLFGAVGRTLRHTANHCNLGARSARKALATRSVAV